MSEIVVERWDRDTSTLMWDPVVRFFVGGPLDGRAIEGADNREWEAGPMAATTDYWHDGWILYTPARDHDHDEDEAWHTYVLHGPELLRRARRKYIDGEITVEAFEEYAGWAVAMEPAP